MNQYEINIQANMSNSLSSARKIIIAEPFKENSDPKCTFCEEAERSQEVIEISDDEEYNMRSRMLSRPMCGYELVLDESTIWSFQVMKNSAKE